MSKDNPTHTQLEPMSKELMKKAIIRASEGLEKMVKWPEDEKPVDPSAPKSEIRTMCEDLLREVRDNIVDAVEWPNEEERRKAQGRVDEVLEDMARKDLQACQPTTPTWKRIEIWRVSTASHFGDMIKVDDGYRLKIFQVGYGSHLFIDEQHINADSLREAKSTANMLMAVMEPIDDD